MIWRAGGTMLLCVAAASVAAQSTNYRSAKAASGGTIRLSYHASMRADCSPAPLPRVIPEETPKYGSLIVRAAKLTTGANAARCPKTTLPAQVVFYQARSGYIGGDRVAYRVEPVSGPAEKHVVEIEVAPAPPRQAPRSPQTDL